MKTSATIFDYKVLPEKYDYLAPDNSEIRLLSQTKYGGIAHCILPPGKTSIAVSHKTVEEIWYILSGMGEMWERSTTTEEVISLVADTSLTIPTGNHFQFRNTGSKPLCILIATMPPWLGKDEAVTVKGYWN
ncbi:MAG TPA: cupin domain-containing protein [Cytophagales bacterium]|nr:cupin domain-containing protein [Cytophagales bacterium]